MFTKSDPFAFSPSAFTANGMAGMPESLRAMAEKGLQQARDGYQQLKSAAESNSGAIEAACHSATKGASDYTAKWLEITKTNVEGAFEFAHALLGSTSVTDAVALASNHARKQFELLASQSQDLIELGKKVASETVEPIKTSATKAFNSAA